MSGTVLLPHNMITNTSSRELVGGKSAQLARMTQHQFPIPTWFCVTTEALSQFLLENELISLLPTKQAKFNEIQQFIKLLVASSFPYWIEKEICTAAENLFLCSPSKALAVRSSANSEDTDLVSCAGLFDSFLGITTTETLLQSIKLCWASLWSSRAIKYRSRQSCTDQWTMAVVIQEFVPADVSGVMFTANPVTGQVDEIVIEASWGLGNLIVSGRITPDYFLVKLREKPSPFEITTTQLGSKRMFLQWDSEQQQIREIVTSPQLQSTLTLTLPQISRLVDYGILLQSHFGYPQDLEWVIHNGSIYLVQSRPITTLATKI